MIKIGENYYRNLEEQVLKNKQDIAEHYNRDRVLADLGIKIVGYAASVNDLPDSTTYQGAYGDGYYVGTQTPYSLYVYTRPDYTSGHSTNYWLNLGPLAITGPEGPTGQTGPAGPQGTRGSIWTSVYTTLPQAVNYNVHDQVLRTFDGNVYECLLDADENKYWSLIGNIQGPQGIQGIQGIQGPQGPQGILGPKGDTGDVGGFINIWGILTNQNQLPLPSSLNNLTVAYLVGSTAPYDLYVQVGSSSSIAVWTNTGPFNAATAVSVNGVYQNVWNADTKQNKLYQHSITLYTPSPSSTESVSISLNIINTNSNTINTWTNLLENIPNDRIIAAGIFSTESKYNNSNTVNWIKKDGTVSITYGSTSRVMANLTLTSSLIAEITVTDTVSALI